MEIKSRERDNVTILELVGNLDTGTAPQLEAKIYELIDSGVHKMALDLTETGFVSSAGLRVFLVAAKKLSVQNGVVKLCCPNEVVKEILDISGFDTILDIRTTLEQALTEMNQS